MNKEKLEQTLNVLLSDRMSILDELCTMVDEQRKFLEHVEDNEDFAATISVEQVLHTNVSILDNLLGRYGHRREGEAVH